MNEVNASRDENGVENIWEPIQCIETIVGDGEEEYIVPLEINGDTFPILGPDLHAALDAKEPYNVWLSHVLESGFFKETTGLSEQDSGPMAVEYMNFEMAKRICLLQKTSQGRYVYELLNQWEKEARTKEVAQLLSDLHKKEQRRRIEEAKAQNTLSLAILTGIVDEEYLTDVDRMSLKNENRELDNFIEVEGEWEIYNDFSVFAEQMNNKKRSLGYGSVYILEIGRYIKIGCSEKILDRIKQHKANMKVYGDWEMAKIAVSSPHKNYLENEKRLHRYFRGRRHENTELFSDSFENVMSAISEGKTGMKFLVEREDLKMGDVQTKLFGGNDNG